MFYRLSLIAVLVAWYQLPVMLERSVDIPGTWLSESVHSTLKTVVAFAGAPTAQVRDATEHWKADTEARIMTASWSAGPAIQAASASSVVRSVTATPIALVSVQTPTAGPGALPTSASGGAGGAAQGVATAADTVSDGRPASTPAVATSAASGAPAATSATSAFQQPRTIVLMGDSVMGEIFFSFKRWSAKNTAWKAIDGHKDSSGLCNTEYYDWPKVAAQLMTEYKPQAVVLTLGPNDAQDIVLDKHWLHFGTDAWKAEYTSRLRRLLEIVTRNGVEVYWPVLPAMRDVGFEHKMAVIREVQARALADVPHVTVVDATGALEDGNGGYEQRAQVDGHTRDLRAKDGIHLAPAGADILVHATTGAMVPGEPAAPGR
jgi:lysophospholipase L1-like esterase